MAQRQKFMWLGSLRDPSYGIDGDGEVFRTLADAAAALVARHRSADWFHEFPVTRTSGIVHQIQYGPLTNEAAMLLWRLDSGDQLTAEELEREAAAGVPVDPGDYFGGGADRFVWIGARQAVRIGSYIEFEAQRALRNRQDVREAGSVVVTDV